MARGGVDPVRGRWPLLSRAPCGWEGGIESQRTTVPPPTQERSLVKHSIILLLVATGLALAACGQSQSAQDKATAQVCDARADIQKQVDELRGLTVTTATVDGVKSNLNAIKADLGKIKDAQGDLGDDRRQQVQAANQAFADQITTIVGSVGRSTSITEAATQAKSALDELADSYEQTLGRIDCG
jgi:hypothetical protein